MGNAVSVMPRFVRPGSRSSASRRVTSASRTRSSPAIGWSSSGEDWGDGHIRGIDIIVVHGGLVTAKLAYVKG
jgi:hypothetical protein